MKYGMTGEKGLQVREPVYQLVTNVLFMHLSDIDSTFSSTLILFLIKGRKRKEKSKKQMGVSQCNAISLENADYKESKLVDL